MYLETFKSKHGRDKILTHDNSLAAQLILISVYVWGVKDSITPTEYQTLHVPSPTIKWALENDMSYPYLFVQLTDHICSY